MSKPKYEKGEQIQSVSDFERSSKCWFKVLFGDRFKTVHRVFLEGFQYHTLRNFINRGWVYEAELVKGESE